MTTEFDGERLDSLYRALWEATQAHKEATNYEMEVAVISLCLGVLSPDRMDKVIETMLYYRTFAGSRYFASINGKPVKLELGRTMEGKPRQPSRRRLPAGVTNRWEEGRWLAPHDVAWYAAEVGQ